MITPTSYHYHFNDQIYKLILISKYFKRKYICNYVAQYYIDLAIFYHIWAFTFHSKKKCDVRFWVTKWSVLTCLLLLLKYVNIELACDKLSLIEISVTFVVKKMRSLTFRLKMRYYILNQCPKHIILKHVKNVNSLIMMKSGLRRKSKQ